MSSPSYRPRFTWHDREYPTLQFTELTWVEMDLVEQITGLTYEELLDRRMSGFSRVSLAMALVSINRFHADHPDLGLGQQEFEVFRTEHMSEVRVLRTPLPGSEGEEDPVPVPERLPATAAEHPAPDAPMYERLGDADPTVADSDGSAPTSETSEPSTSVPSPS